MQRVGNPLINELIIGTGSKDRFSMDAPANDAQFLAFFADPGLPRVLNAVDQHLPPDRKPLMPALPPLTRAR